MANIHNFKLPPSTFPEFLIEKTTTLNHILNITDNILEYKFTRTKSGEEEADTVIYDLKLNLDTIKSHPRFCDQSYWTFTNPMFPTEDYQTPVLGTQLLSIFEKTYVTKQRPFIDQNKDVEYLFPIRVFVPSSASSFNDCEFFVLSPQDEVATGFTIVDPWNITINVVKGVSDTYTNNMVFVTDVMATITTSTTVDSPTPGTKIPVAVTCSEPTVLKLYLEPIVGLLDRTEVVMTNGTGMFNIFTDTLTTGDIAKVKIGYKKFSNVISFTKTIA